MTDSLTLQQKLDNGRFVVTAEIVPPLTGDGEQVAELAAPLKGHVDGVNVTDGAGARASMSSLAACAVLAREGFEPIMQMTCRDRNKLALYGDLLGASVLGIRNLLVLHGDNPEKSDLDDVTPVYNVDSKGLISMAADLERIGEREVKKPPSFFVGCADAPFAPPDDWTPTSLEGKIAAGARFAQTQFCFDLEVARAYFARLGDFGITEKLSFIVGVGPLASVKQARFMDEKLFGVSVPAATIQRMEQAADPKAEGRAICAEIVAGLKDIPGVSGVHIMAPLQPPSAIAETIRAF